MGHLWLKATKVSFSAEYGPQSKFGEETALVYEVMTHAETRVDLATGGRLRDLAGCVRVLPLDPLSPEGSSKSSGSRIGLMYYFRGHQGEPHISPHILDRYIIEARIPQPQFERLFALASRSRIPPDVHVEVEGMPLLDEFTQHWDNKAAEELPVTFIGFLMALAIFEPADENHWEEKGRFTSPTQSDARSIMHWTALGAGQLARLNQKLAWLIVAVIGLGALILLHWLR